MRDFLRFFEPFGQHVDRKLVSGHHDGGIGNLADQLRHETPIQTSATLVFVNGVNGLPKRSVDGVFFS